MRRGTGWTDPINDTGKYHIYYDRRKRVLYDLHKGSGGLESWGDVTDDAIRAVARENGGFEDLARHGCRDTQP